MFRGVSVDFQKIGYSLVLMPFFAISDVVLRLKAIGLGNIFLLNLSVIFAWLLAGELGLTRRAKYFIAIFTALLPEMLLFVTFMSEMLYWPLFLLFFWLWAVNERKESYMLAILEVILCYMIYLTKEVFLASILAYISFEVLYPLIERKKVERKRFLRLGMFIASFGLCYLAMKLTLFRGMGNSYNQMGLQAIMSPYNFLFTGYAFFYYLAGLMVAGLVIPFVYPLVNFRAMNEISRKVYVYLILSMIITAGVLAYTVSVRENLGSARPSIMLRYFGASLVILTMLFFSSTQNVSLTNSKNAWPAVAFSLMYVCLVFKGFIVNTNTDHYWLLWYLAIDMKLGIMPPPNVHHAYSIDINATSMNLPADPQKVIYTSAIAANLLLVITVLFFQYVYSRKGPKATRKTYAWLLLAACCVLNVGAYAVLKFSYSVDSEAVREVTAINEYFKNDAVSDILYLTHGDVPKKRFDRAGRYMDTYFERRHKLYIVNNSTIPDNRTKIVETTLNGEWPGKNHEGVEKIDYIIIQNYDSQGSAASPTLRRSTVSAENITLSTRISIL